LSCFLCLPHLGRWFQTSTIEDIRKTEKQLKAEFWWGEANDKPARETLAPPASQNRWTTIFIRNSIKP
jgi:hypothetical protein